MMRALWCLALSLIVACGATMQDKKDLVQRRSAREWECERESVRVRHLGGGVYEAKGCGQRATYLCEQRPENVAQAQLGSGRLRCILESRDGNEPVRGRPTTPPPAAPASKEMPAW